MLFPGGPLPLRIFEPRYIDMVSASMKSDTPFGVLLIKEGEEAGPATTYEVGTLAKITDFYQGSDGLLGVTALGGQRFRLISNERQHNGLNIGEVELIDAEAALPLPAGTKSGIGPRPQSKVTRSRCPRPAFRNLLQYAMRGP